MGLAISRRNGVTMAFSNTSSRDPKQFISRCIKKGRRTNVLFQGSRTRGGKAYVLHNTFPLDGRISAYPISARGHSVSNCYLLKEDAGALLLDTGYAVHEAEILAQLASILDPATPLSLLPLRINEFMSVGNAMAIAKRFNVVECLAPVPKINEWLEFETIDPGGANNGNPTLHTTLLKPLHLLDIGARHIEVMNAADSPHQHPLDLR